MDDEPGLSLTPANVFYPEATDDVSQRTLSTEFKVSQRDNMKRGGTNSGLMTIDPEPVKMKESSEPELTNLDLLANVEKTDKIF